MVWSFLSLARPEKRLFFLDWGHVQIREEEQTLVFRSLSFTCCSVGMFVFHQFSRAGERQAPLFPGLVETRSVNWNILDSIRVFKLQTANDSDSGFKISWIKKKEERENGNVLKSHTHLHSLQALVLGTSFLVCCLHISNILMNKDKQISIRNTILVKQRFKKREREKKTFWRSSLSFNCKCSESLRSKKIYRILPKEH